MESTLEENLENESIPIANLYSHRASIPRELASFTTNNQESIGICTSNKSSIGAIHNSHEGSTQENQAISMRDVTVDSSVRKPASLSAIRKNSGNGMCFPQGTTAFEDHQKQHISPPRAERHSNCAGIHKALKEPPKQQESQPLKDLTVPSDMCIAQHLQHSMTFRKLSSACTEIYKEVEKRHNTSMEAHEFSKLPSTCSLGGAAKRESTPTLTTMESSTIYGNLLSRTAGTAWQRGIRTVALVVDWVIASRNISVENPSLDETEVCFLPSPCRHVKGRKIFR
jgi:hypothetical protein